MLRLKKLILSILLLFSITVSFAQNIDIYGIWFETIETNNESEKYGHLVQLNPLTAEFTSVGIIPNLFSINVGSSTFDHRNGSYIFRGKDAITNTRELYSVNIDDGSLNNNLELTESAIEWEYDLRNSKLYGLKFIQTGQLYDTILVDNDYYGNIDTVITPIGLPNGNQYLVSIDMTTGENTVIGFIDGVISISINSSTFNSNNGSYIFVGKDTTNTRKLYSIDVATGNTISSPQTTPYGYLELTYNNVNDKLYGIQNGGGSLKFGEVDLNTANFTLLNDLSFLANGAIGISTTVLDQNTGYYILTGSVSGNRSIYIIETSTGTLVNTVSVIGNIFEWEIDNYTNFARTFYQIENDADYCNINLVLDTTTIYSGNYQAGETLESQSKIKPNANVTFTAKDTISLQSNFTIEEDATFNASINDCVEEAGCCPEDPLSELFSQFIIEIGGGIKILQAKDENGNCIFSVDSHYSPSCEISYPPDYPVFFYDCTGASMCQYGGRLPIINTCEDLFGTSFIELEWQMIYSCDMQ